MERSRLVDIICEDETVKCPNCGAVNYLIVKVFLNFLCDIINCKTCNHFWFQSKQERKSNE